jgi:glutamate formiminotransferase / 5-formyltetrahydrofolate cyclo-ligase
MKRIVQCVPNFSEGKDLELIEKIVEPLKNQEGFKLISYEPDKDYNRTVVTLLGDPSSMIEPLIKFMAKVTKHVDMNKQKGEHPRMGATDVVPFIPIQNITMEECAEIANEMGKRISDTLNIPVFMYAEAAKKADRKSLPSIRKGEFEGMKDKIKEENWHPDYGNPEIHPTAGVTGVGARMPLIAYNIDLATEDIEVAKRIAKAIRGSSGGFKHIQAGPVYLNERKHVQVTMNILNYKQNPIYRIFETVIMEAKREHVEVPNTEIVGLIPKDTILRSLEYYFDVHNIKHAQPLTIEQITAFAKEYLKFRDFDTLKIIEANME